MDYQSLHIKTVVELKKLAKLMDVRVPAGTNKSMLIDMLLEADRAGNEKRAARERQDEAREQGMARTPGEEQIKAPEKAEAPKPHEDVGQAAPRRRGRPRKTPIEAPAPKAPEAQAETPSRSPEAPAPTPAPQRRAAPSTATAAAAEPVRRAGSDGAAVEPGAKPEPARSGSPAAQPRTPEGVTGRQADAREAEPGGAGTPAQEPARSRLAPRSFTGRGSVRTADSGAPQRESAARPAMRPTGDSRPQAPEGVPHPAQRVFQRQEAMPRATAPDGGAPDRASSAIETGSARGRREGYYNAEYKTSNPAVPEMLSSGECSEGAGVLEIQPDGYGFLRAENCLPGPNDVYLSIAQIRRFNLRMGDYVEGKTRPQREGDRYSAMLYITSVNGEPPEAAANRPRFEDLVPVYPDERIRLEDPEPVGRGDFSLRLVDMLAPIGKGQRGMIVSQPKAGKTTLLKKVANAITARYPEIELIVLLIDERPEEVTDMKRSIDGEVIYSTFDEEPEHHVRVSEMVLERAQRLVEMGKDVVVLMDSITRLARAYNLVISPTGRSLSGGLDPGALFKPKRFFGAARNIENGGSLTVIATALVETGSRMDDIIFEEFKGTGNMELHLDRKLSDKRVFPAIDMLRSGTRREELLLTEAELDGEMLVRRVLSGGRSQEMAEQIIDLMSKTPTNAVFFDRLKGWLEVFEKGGYSLGGRS